MTAAERLARFVHDFGVPFLSGQRCTVGDFLGKEGFEAVYSGLSVEREMVEACDDQLVEAALFCDVTPAPFDEDAATLLYAVHELYAACHPQAQSFYARAHLFCQAAEQAVRALPRTYDPERLVTRHLIVMPAFAATRTDVTVKWWTGSASFYGEEPPRRLMALPGLRRVDVDRKTTPLWRLAMVEGDEETRVARVSLMNALLNLSPLTRLVLLGDPVQKQLGFSLTLPLKMRGRRMSPVFALDDRRLARAVTDAILERGVDRAGPMLALALLAGVRESAAPVILRRAAELCVHLVLVMCLSEAENPGVKEAATLRALFDDDIAKMNEALRVFWATARAAIALDGEQLALPSEGELPEAAAGLWRRLKKRLLHPHLAPIADPLTRELSRRLPGSLVEGGAQPPSS